MLTPPNLSDDTIIACLRDEFGLRIEGVTFLALGADVNAFVYRVEANDGTPYFLKLRRGDFAEVAVAIPAYLHARGIPSVMAPLALVGGRLWVSRHDYVWILYPFFEGKNGYHAALSDAQWVTFGRSLRAVHATALPPELSNLVPHEVYSPRSREMVAAFDHQVLTNTFDDPVARNLASFWRAKRRDICAMVERAEQLGRTLRQRAGTFVLCHADLHPGNVLVNEDGDLAIVDWDNPVFAPKERDLMCLSGGVSNAWNDAREDALFYRGYGSVAIDPVALAYYRYERIVADVAEYGAQIFGVWGSADDREEGLVQLMRQFLPNHVVAIAHRTFEQLS